MSLKSKFARWLASKHPQAWLQVEIARHSPHFEPEYWLLPKLCSRDALSIDAGGNEGHFAYYMSLLSKAVHVFEPNLICLARLKKLRRSNMEIHELALSDHEGESTLRFDPENTGVGTIEQSNRLDRNAGVHGVLERRVSTARLDEFGLRNVRFLKIDVEGHEPSVVRGAKELLAREQPVLLIECERRHNPAAFEQLNESLAPLGYTCWRLAGTALVSVRPEEVAALQSGEPGSPGYANNFLFFPPRFEELRRSLSAGR